MLHAYSHTTSQITLNQNPNANPDSIHITVVAQPQCSESLIADALPSRINEIETLAGKKPSVVLESTGHYHTPVVQFLEEHQYVYNIVNPLISHRAKGSSLRKVKTDAVDAY
ncbi:MAG: family transposase, partial [Paenibacillus sp.]|nr:family transposase [Paenibacillus sp.]